MDETSKPQVVAGFFKPVRMGTEEPEWMHFDMRPMNYRAAIRRCKRTRHLAMKMVFLGWRLASV